MTEPKIAEEPDKGLAEEQDDAAARPQGEEPGAAEQDDQEDEIQQLLRDPEALDRVNKTLATEAAGKEQEPAGESAPVEKDKAPDPGVDEDPVVETIVYKGREEQVRKSKAKDLLSKGRHLELVLEQLSPLRGIAEDPELFGAVQAALKNPDGKKRLLTLLRERAEDPSAGKPELPEVPGYTPQEVAESMPLIEAVIKQMGLSGLGGDVQQAKVEMGMAAVIAEEPEEESLATISFANQALLDLEQKHQRGEVDPAAYERFRRDLDDPNKPENFFRFIRDMRAQRKRLASGGGGELAAATAEPEAKKIVVRQKTGAPQGNQDRMGSGEGGRAPAGARRSAWDIPDDEWERTLR